MAGVDDLIARGIADPEKLAIGAGLRRLHV